MITKKSLRGALKFETILFQNCLGLIGAGDGTLKPAALARCVLWPFSDFDEATA